MRKSVSIHAGSVKLPGQGNENLELVRQFLFNSVNPDRNEPPGKRTLSQAERKIHSSRSLESLTYSFSAVWESGSMSVYALFIGGGVRIATFVFLAPGTTVIFLQHAKCPETDSFTRLQKVQIIWMEL